MTTPNEQRPAGSTQENETNTTLASDAPSAEKTKDYSRGLPFTGHEHAIVLENDEYAAKFVPFLPEVGFVREAVFFGEQNVPMDCDLDEADEDPSVCVHVAVYHKVTMETVAVGRILSDGHIGRVSVLKAHRGKGLGNMVMRALLKCPDLPKTVWLGSQEYAIPFYEKLGFTVYGDMFYDGDTAMIPHYHMKLTRE
ncbi:Acetyltransferase (GNAT) domain [Carpediemonas membranifera]|uniref:Glucosamine 6-phosphate N-acetyltransferase n=1 Tax=Carpediemonas membranifera TaxID=201153 RepID=A0A8J6E215_9EUKA|nr:Acetyltransferase (GNAT) domain [Carpediemonas membranifera]|eukprot:KAG9397059.1 Acetyltransferase (GNAT) domain [Carpediemonas membranifera]